MMTALKQEDIDEIEIRPNDRQKIGYSSISRAYFYKSGLDEDGLRSIVIGCLIFFTLITAALIIQISFGKTAIPYRIGIVTPEEVCSNIGGEMIRKGGNSLDAFIASSLCLAVVNPFAAGFGAGGFMVVRDHKRDKNIAINCYFESGSNISVSQDYEKRPTGLKSIAIPGELQCLIYVYRNYANLDWNTLVSPAIKLSQNGFKVSKLLAENIKKLDKSVIESNTYLKEMYLDGNGNLVKENAIIKNRLLAKALQSLVKNEDGLYRMDKELGKDLLETSKFQFTDNDLKKYSIRSDSVLAHYKDFSLFTTSYPSSGPIFKFILELMEQLNFEKDIIMKNNVYFYQKLLEALRVGYIALSNIADNIESMRLLDSDLNLIISEFANRTDNNTSINVTNILKEFSLNDDIYVNYVTVNDHNDLMVSYVGTLGSVWGSQIMTKNGYMLNNGLSLFSYKEYVNYNQNNAIGQNKQPRGLMLPIIAYNRVNLCAGRFVISYSHNQVDDYGLSSLLQVIIKLFTDLSYYPRVIDEKRLKYYANETYFEDGFDETLKQQIITTNSHHYMSNTTKTNCTYESINIVMKKYHIVDCIADGKRGLSNKNGLFFNS